jgi:nicotinamide riboside transporter PnuC
MGSRDCQWCSKPLLRERNGGWKVQGSTPYGSAIISLERDSMLYIELFSSFLAIVGSYLLASNSKHKKWAWLMYAISSLGFIAVAMTASLYGLLATQVVFLFVNGLGIYNNFWKEGRNG